jgi:DNA-binding MarR family transcriptional regulator
MAVTFGAVIEYQRGLASAMRDKRHVTVPAMLLGIAANPHGTIGQLADLLGIDIKTCSRLLKGVRDRKWVTVEHDTRDERQRRVNLTEDGESVAQIIHGSLVDLAFRIVENTVGPQVSAEFTRQEARSPRKIRRAARATKT